MPDLFHIHRTDRACAIGIGPPWRRLVLSHVRGDRWRFGGWYVTLGTGSGGYVGLVIGERMDDAPQSVSFGPVQLVRWQGAASGP
jgi:hypothetical protein